MTFYSFSFPTNIKFGNKVRFEIASLLKEKKFEKPLIITDQGVAKLDFFDEFIEYLTAENILPTIYSSLIGNPVKTDVDKGVQAYKNSESDSIIAIGGGASLDVAKAVGLMSTNEGDLFDYAIDAENKLNIKNSLPFWIAMPTTSGTGSEVGRSTVISDDKTHQKKIIGGPEMLAPYVFADPELTVALPKKITAATGMDALSHLVEAFVAQGYHPICDGISLEGINLIKNNLEEVVHNPENLDARGNMLMAAMMGAIAFQKGLGIVHSCAHALSTVVDMHHGLANGIMINYALETTIDAIPDYFSRLSQSVGKGENPQGFINWLVELRSKIGIPNKLSEVGVKEEHLDKLSEIAFADPCHQECQLECNIDTFKNIFRKAL